MTLELSGRPERDADEVGKFTVAASGPPFSDIRGD
jgi:hypothetical protein